MVFTHSPTHAASIMITCGRFPWCALLDTGAEINCVSHRVCTLLGMSTFLTSYYVINGIGPHRCHVLRIIELIVWISSFEASQRFAVVEDSAISLFYTGDRLARLRGSTL